jgi:hypothetical protein
VLALSPVKPVPYIFIKRGGTSNKDELSHFNTVESEKIN